MLVAKRRGMPRLYWQHRYISKALGICCDKDLTGFENLLGLDTSRARRAIISMFAVSVVGGYYYIMAPCHPDGREGSQAQMTESELYRHKQCNFKHYRGFGNLFCKAEPSF